MSETLLRTFYPCCNKRTRVSAVDALPRQNYMRRCRDCETTYLVERRTRTHGGMQIHFLTWTDTKSHDYRRRYGTT